MATPPAPGQQPTPQQIAAMQAQITQEAAKRGMTPQQFQLWQRQQMEADAKKAGLSFDEYINRLKQHALETHQRKQQLAQQQQAAEQSGQPHTQQGKSEQQVPITPGAPDPKALALAKWMRGQDLKTRTCILNGQRKDMFRVKRALRALQSPAYAAAASKKNSLLPPITPEQPVQEIFKLLPLSLLALRVSKADPHEGHDHGPSTSKKAQKRVKGLWNVKIEPQQDIEEDLHYIWLYEGPQWKQKLYAAGALAAIMAVVMFPLWPIKLRLGVWYLSMGVLGLIGLFTVMSIFRLILFCITYFAVPPGLWLYPNLFEDVGFFDSFKPLWGWQEGKKKKKKSKDASDVSSKQPANSEKSATTSSSTTEAPNATVASTSPSATSVNANASRRFAPRVEEVDED